VSHTRNPDERRADEGQDPTDLLEWISRPRQMFENMSGEHEIEAGSDVCPVAFAEIGLEEGTLPFARTAEVVDVHADDVVAPVPHPFRQEVARTAEVQDIARQS